MYLNLSDILKASKPPTKTFASSKPKPSPCHRTKCKLWPIFKSLPPSYAPSASLPPPSLQPAESVIWFTIYNANCALCFTLASPPLLWIWDSTTVSLLDRTPNKYHLS
jgi:hypothetical protein